MNEEVPSDGRRNLSQRGFKFVPIKILDSRQIALILHYGGGKIKGINISCYNTITEIQTSVKCSHQEQKSTH
jgi:hypothetical protein